MIALVLLSGCAETIWGRQMDCAGVEQFSFTGGGQISWGELETTSKRCDLYARPYEKGASLEQGEKQWSFDGYGEIGLQTNDPGRIVFDLADTAQEVALWGTSSVNDGSNGYDSLLKLQDQLLDFPATGYVDTTNDAFVLEAPCCSIELEGTPLSGFAVYGRDTMDRVLGSWVGDTSSQGDSLSNLTLLPLDSDFRIARIHFSEDAKRLQLNVYGIVNFEELSVSLPGGSRLDLYLQQAGVFNFTGMIPELPDGIEHDPDALRVIDLDVAGEIIIHHYSGS